MNFMMKKIVNFYKKLGFIHGAVLTICLTSAISIATVNIPGFYIFSPNTPISASQINSNFDKLANQIQSGSSQTYLGTWDANDVLPSATATGEYYVVSVANPPYAVGDKIIFNGTTFDHVPGGSQPVIDKTTTQDIGKLRIYGANATNYVELSAAALTGNRSLTFPDSNGSSGQVLSTDGTGNLSWITPAAGGTPSGSAGGDLAGTYPNPTILSLAATKISSGSVDNTEFNYLDGVTSPIQSQLSTIQSQMGTKENGIIGGSISQFFRGDKTWQMLDTGVVSEGTNLYFTNPRVLGVPLTGFASSSNVVLSAADTVLNAFEKVQGQINAINSNASHFLAKDSTDSITGTVNVSSGFLTITNPPATLTDATNKQYVDTQIAMNSHWQSNAGDINRLTGKVGIGTNTPSDTLHIFPPNMNSLAVIESSNSTYEAQMLFKQGSVSGSVGFINGSTFVLQSLQTAPMKFATNGSYRMTIDSTGNVGVGITSPTTKLDVNGDVKIASGSTLYFGSTPVCTTAGCTASSDKRLKENISPLKNSLEKILSLKAYEYDYKKEFKISDKHQIGVIAQEVEKVFPEVVLTDEKTGIKAVAYDHLVAPLIEAVKSIYGKLNSHDQEIATLKAENQMLKEYLCHKDKNAPMCE